MKQSQAVSIYHVSAQVMYNHSGLGVGLHAQGFYHTVISVFISHNKHLALDQDRSAVRILVIKAL